MFLCPKCENQARLGAVKGTKRNYSCMYCSITFNTQETLVCIEDVPMTIKDKVHKYLETHIAPVTVSDLANRFAVRKETIGNALRKLEEEGIAQRQRVSTVFVWSRARSFKPMAIPQNPNRHVGFVPQHVKQSSYAHVRGYDD